MGFLNVAKTAVDRSFWEWVFFIFDKYKWLYIRGAGVTLLIALSGTIVGFAIGVLIGVIRTVPYPPNQNPFIKGLRKCIDFILSAYIEVFRGTPMIVQAMVIYFGFVQITGIQLNILFAGFFIVSINTGAYMAEIVRGGILSIDKGQFEAAHSVGMTHFQMMLTVILPQAIRNILPAIGNEFIINIKDTSVLSVISLTELFFISRSAVGTYYRTFEAYLITCIMYFIMTFTITKILRGIEKKMDGPSSYTIHGSQTTPESELKIKRGGVLK